MTAEQTALKEALEIYGRTIDLEITYGTTTLTSKDVTGFIPSYEGGLLTAIMKQAEIELDGVGGPEFAEAIKGERLYIKLYVKGGGKTANKEYGTFIIKDAKYNDESNSIKLTCYDLLLPSMSEYSSVIEFPPPKNAEGETEEGTEGETEEEIPAVTLGRYLQAICDFLGIPLATPTFTNSDVIIEEEKYNADYTFRDVLTEIAQAAGGTIALKNDELYVLYPTETDITVEPSNLKSITVGEIYGPVNSVVLARTPQEENIYKKDEAAEKICEIKIENNQIMDSHREDFIEGIYNALYGLTYYPHEVESYGIGILDICDLFTIETLDGRTYTALHLSGEMTINQGFVERTKGEAPAATETDYKAASKTDRLLNKTILRVDKQEGLISALVTKTTEKTNDLTDQLEKVKNSVEATMSEKEINLLISETVEGIDSITTSTGYKFNKDGLNIHKSGEEINNTIDHTGMYVDRNDDNVLTANHEGVDAINLKTRQFLIIGQNSRFEDYGDGRTACFYIGG